MSKLSFYQNDWANAAIQSNEYITPEDGKYRVIIESVEYSEVDKDGNSSDPTFIYTFQILEGSSKGQKFRRYTTIRNERSASFLKGDLQILGMPIPSDPEDLPQLFLSAAGIVLDLTVKTKTVNDKNYKDVYFNKLVGRQQIQQQLPQRQAPQQYQQPPQNYTNQPPQYQQQQYQQAQQQGFVPYNEEIPF